MNSKMIQSAALSLGLALTLASTAFAGGYERYYDEHDYRNRCNDNSCFAFGYTETVTAEQLQNSGDFVTIDFNNGLVLKAVSVFWQNDGPFFKKQGKMELIVDGKNLGEREAPRGKWNVAFWEVEECHNFLGLARTQGKAKFGWVKLHYEQPTYGGGIGILPVLPIGGGVAGICPGVGPVNPAYKLNEAIFVHEVQVLVRAVGCLARNLSASEQEAHTLPLDNVLSELTAQLIASGSAAALDEAVAVVSQYKGDVAFYQLKRQVPILTGLVDSISIRIKVLQEKYAIYP